MKSISTQELFNQFYSIKDKKELLLVVDQLLSRRCQIRGQVLASDISLQKLKERLREDYARNRGFVVRGNGICLLQKADPHATKDSVESEARVLLWQDRQTKNVHILSCQERDSFDYIRSALLRYLVPEVYVVYLRTKEIRKSLVTLVKRHYGLSVRVREYIARSLIDDPNSVKKVRSKREWTDEEYAAVFEKLAEQNQWLTAIHLMAHGKKEASARVWRDASFSCDEGFEFFMDTLGTALQDAILSSRKFFEKRGMMDRPTAKSRPLKINYREGVFLDKRQNYRLIQVLKEFSDSDLTVIHPNPYLRASLIDYSDGSAYDIWVTTPTSILIVPKRKATVQSIERLCNHICDNFEEGELSES